MNNMKDALNKALDERSIKLKPKRGEIYRHFKGKYYIVEDIAYDTERQAESVVYRAAYGECKLFTRDLRMFLETLPTGVARFTKVKSLPDESAENPDEVRICPKCGHKNKINPKYYQDMISQLPFKILTEEARFAALIHCERCGEIFKTEV